MAEMEDDATKPVAYSADTAAVHAAPPPQGASARQGARLRQAWPQNHANLNNGLECADAPRNMRENLASPAGEKMWLENRAIALSECSLSLWPFLKTLLFESLPLLASWPLCVAMEGSVAAANRGLNPVQGLTVAKAPQKLVGWILSELTFGAQALIWATVIFCMLYSEELPASAPFEIFGMILLAMLAKAAVVATKYGFKSDLLLSAGGLHECIYSDGYAKTHQRDRGQMAEYVLNINGMQKEELLKFIYKSQLLANTDLSCASFSWEPPASAGAATLQGQNVARQVWEAMLELTKDVEEDLAFEEIDKDQSGGISLEEMQARAKESLGAEYDADTVRAQFNELDTDGNAQVSAAELRARSLGTTCKLMFSAKHGLLSTLLREDEQTLRQRAQAGELPATVLAVLLVLESSWIPPQVGVRYLLGMVVVPALFVSFLPVIVRACIGMPAFGTTWQATSLASVSILLMFFTFFPLILYFALPCVWLYRQMLVCRRLLALISVAKGFGVKWHSESSNLGAVQVAAQKTEAVGSLRRTKSVVGGRGSVGDVHLDEILLDLRMHSNVTAWAALWRVLHGTAYMPATQIKFQFYGIICTSVFFISAGLDSFGDTILAAMGSQRTLGVDFKITSLVRLMLLTIPLVAMTLLAFAINRYPAAYTRALHHAVVSASSTIAALRRPRSACRLGDDEREELLAELEASNAVMAAVIDEVSSAGEVEPMRVLFLRAEPAVVSILMSAILAVVAVQLRGLSAIVI